MPLLTKQEQEIFEELGKCFAKFTELPVYHPADKTEFMQAIHVCQNIILSRPGYASQSYTGLWEQRNAGS